MKTLVSCGTLPLRPEIQTSCLPSGLNMGNASNPSSKVICWRPLPSRPKRLRSKSSAQLKNGSFRECLTMLTTMKTLTPRS